MHRYILIGALLMQASLAFGSPLCLTGTLQSYIGLGAGGCMVGSTVFSNFTTVPGQSFASIIDPTLVQVLPGPNPNLMFTLNTTAGPGILTESIFRFSATGALGAAGLGLGSASASGDGAALGILDICPGGSFSGNSPSGCPGGALSGVALPGSGTLLTASGSSFDVFVDLTADGGSAGTAALGSATVSFNVVNPTAVPEPAAFWALGTGLAVLGLYRKASRQNSLKGTKNK